MWSTKRVWGVATSVLFAALTVLCLLCRQVHDGTNTPLNQFLKDPDSLITRVTWKDEQDKVGTWCSAAAQYTALRIAQSDTKVNSNNPWLAASSWLSDYVHPFACTNDPCPH